ncbi:hypothetical protein AM493_14895 [Flavobacterium akiainvivens]|uniref:Uncharacterized protein n=1 Tax=Flavobacterium akiainvivens TaxID=1202724 RepID=A0A0M8MCC0_9FLAO|nr:hypothetical protein [Flavobacterium akiainvivens]KOS07185.1 hypothetical protein AM493_14895 [Flavobacterium akiainvivens]SFQ72854.1 hypothetical protein SAMN05444144_11832 [Flavobacterium akiainvivens]
MNLDKALQVLEALASGCSPKTGEIVADESILNERDVIRALQVAIELLKKETFISKSNIDIQSEEIEYVTNVFREKSISLTINNLVGFFLGTKKFKDSTIIKNSFYKKYSDVYTQGQLIDFFSEYLGENGLGKNKDEAYREIDFFQKERFNRLTENAINQLKEKINEIGVLKTENLSEYVQNSRKNYARAYESWSEKEKELLSKALKYTNDLDLLSECFQRGKGSIESLGQKLIYESLNDKVIN